MAKKKARAKAAVKKTASKLAASNKGAGKKSPKTKKAAAKKSSRKQAATKKKRASGKRELIDTGRDKRFVRRDAEGQFSESDDVGRSLSADRRRKAKKKARPGLGDRGD